MRRRVGRGWGPCACRAGRAGGRRTRGPGRRSAGWRRRGRPGCRPRAQRRPRQNGREGGEVRVEQAEFGADRLKFVPSDVKIQRVEIQSDQQPPGPDAGEHFGRGPPSPVVQSTTTEPGRSSRDSRTGSSRTGMWRISRRMLRHHRRRSESGNCSQCRLKYCTSRSCFSAASRESKVPRLRRLPVFGFCFFE